MKYVVVLLLCAVGVFIYVSRTNLPIQKNSILITPTPENQEIPTSGGYRYFLEVINPQNLFVAINQEESFRTLVTKNNCLNAINGGYYDAENKPLGAIVSRGVQLNSPHVSDTLNGYLTIKNSNVKLLSTFDASARTVVQSGPILMVDNIDASGLNDTDRARRSIIGIDDNSDVVFIMIFGKDNTYDGPTLKELPTIIRSIASQENLRITDALNLDGGGASAFYSPRFFKSELERVGSILCEKRSP